MDFFNQVATEDINNTMSDIDKLMFEQDMRFNIVNGLEYNLKNEVIVSNEVLTTTFIIAGYEPSEALVSANECLVNGNEGALDLIKEAGEKIKKAGKAIYEKIRELIQKIISFFTGRSFGGSGGGGGGGSSSAATVEKEMENKDIKVLEVTLPGDSIIATGCEIKSGELINLIKFNKAGVIGYQIGLASLMNVFRNLKQNSNDLISDFEKAINNLKSFDLKKTSLKNDIHYYTHNDQYGILSKYLIDTNTLYDELIGDSLKEEDFERYVFLTARTNFKEIAVRAIVFFIDKKKDNDLATFKEINKTINPEHCDDELKLKIYKDDIKDIIKLLDGDEIRKEILKVNKLWDKSKKEIEADKTYAKLYSDYGKDLANLRHQDLLLAGLFKDIIKSL